jgi:hypothetical protein
LEVTPLSAWGDIQDPTGTKPANNADVTNYNDTRVSNVIEENNTLSVSRPVGASFNNNQLAVTGMIRIILPQGFTNTMMKFTVNVYTYSQDKSFSLNLAGYNHYNSGAWYSTEANLLGSTAADNRVRFGYDSTLGKCCIYIGEPTSSWSIPKVMVKDFIAGYSNFARSQWETGWAIDIVTSAPQNVSQDYADALIDAASIRNQGTLATANSANWSSQVTGTGKPADYADVTAYNTAAGIAGQGAFATLNKVTSSNASTFIDNAAIGSAQIANAAISNAQIDRASVNKLQVVTADIVDANVSTLKIAGNAVTMPISSYNATGYSLGSSFTDYVLGSITVVSTGQPAFIFFGCAWSIPAYSVQNIKLIRDSTTIYVASKQPVAFVSDKPTAGTHTYYFTATITTASYQTITNISLMYMELKR